METSPQKNTLQKIAWRLSGIHEDDMTIAEKQISKILANIGLLIKNENGEFDCKTK